MTDSEKYEAVRSHVTDWISEKYDPFDAALLITYNSSALTTANFWSFAGHPDCWGKKELNDMAIQLLEITVESMRAMNPEARLGGALTPRKKIAWSWLEHGQDRFLIVAASWLPKTKRLYLFLELMKAELGFHVKWFEGTDRYTKLEFWSLEFLMGCFSIRFSGDT